MPKGYSKTPVPVRRFWIDRSCLKEEGFLIEGPLLRHIRQVCRIKQGEIFELLCEGTQKYQVSLSRVSPSKATAKILSVCPAPLLKKPYLHLALSLPRLPKADFIVEKAIELGVKSFHPLVSEFSFLRSAGRVSWARQKKWDKIALNSLAQSGRVQPMKIHSPSPLSEIKIPKEDTALMAYEGDGDLPLLPDLLKSQPRPPALWLFVGSEGGFSRQEALRFAQRENGFLCSFGDQILRVETACLFGLSALKCFYRL